MYYSISLCTVAYKSVTKIVANPLQTILPKLIGPHQTSLVPDRHIIENIVAIKVYLEKAYDHLSRSFILETLRETGIPVDLIQLLWNASQLQK